MKLIKIFSIFAALLVAPTLSFAQHDHGHGHDHGGAPEWAELFGDASLPTVWHSASVSAQRISAALKSGRVDGVADWAETVHLAAHALMDQVEESDTAKRQRLQAVLGQAAKIADEVLDAAHHGEVDRAAREFRRLNSAIMLTGTRLPKAVTEGDTDEPRFATAGAHDH